MTFKKLTVTILALPPVFALLASALLPILASTLLPLPASAQKDNLFPPKDWINFQWEEVTLGETKFDKAVMLVPTRIESLPYAFTLELDLGATSTMLYGNTLIPYMKLSPTLPGKLDTSTKRFRLEGQMNGGFRNLSLTFDGHPFIVPDVAYFKDFGDSLTMDSARSGTPKYIGSLGAPFFSNKVLIIDYPNHRFRLEDSLDKKGEAHFEFAACKMQNGRIKIPFVIGGQTYWLLFDTGSSIFPMAVSETYYHQFTGDTPEDTLGISSWGKTIPAYGKKMQKPVQFGTMPLPPAKVFFVSGFDDFYKDENILGLTGNAFFLNDIIAIDFRNDRFGIFK